VNADLAVSAGCLGEVGAEGYQARHQLRVSHPGEVDLGRATEATGRDDCRPPESHEVPEVLLSNDLCDGLEGCGAVGRAGVEDCCGELQAAGREVLKGREHGAVHAIDGLRWQRDTCVLVDAWMCAHLVALRTRGGWGMKDPVAK